MKRWLFISLFGVMPLWALNIGDTIEVYLPQLRSSFAWDKFPTKAYIADTAYGAYIAVFRYNLYPFRIIEVANFRDFPPAAWEAGPQWSNKIEIEGSSIYYPFIKYTSDGFTGTTYVQTPRINLYITNTVDTVVFTYKLTYLNPNDTIKVMFAKVSDTTCWVSAGVITPSPTRTQGRFPVPIGGPCGLSDNDTVFARIVFVDNSNLSLDTTRYFAIYDFYVGGRTYRPYRKAPRDVAPDTLSISKADSIVSDIKNAWNGVKSAIDNFMGVNPSDLVDKDGNGRVIILVGPYHTVSPADVSNFPDAALWPPLVFYDVFDENNAEIIYLNTAWNLYYSKFPTSDPNRIDYLRKALAFYYAKYVAYSVDRTEADTSRYSRAFINMNLSFKAAWIAHKAMVSSFDPDSLYSYAKGIFNDILYSFGTGADATYLFSTATLYDGKMARWRDIAKNAIWMLYLEEITSENDVKNAIRERDIPFIYLPVIPNSALNLINSRGKTFQEAYEEFSLKVFAAGRPYISRISGFPTFSNPLLRNTVLSSNPPSISLKANQLTLYSATAFSFGSSSVWLTFDGDDNNFINDTLSGYKVYVIDTVSNTFNTLNLDSRNRGYITRAPSFALIINYGNQGVYVAGDKDTTDALVRPVTLLGFFVQPNYAFKRYVDVYAITDTFAYFDASYNRSADGLEVIFYPNDTSRYGYTIITLKGVANRVYGASTYLWFKDIANNSYYGPIYYKIYRLQSFAGFDYRKPDSVSDSGVIQSVKIGKEIVEAYPNLLYMRSLSSERDILVFHNQKGEFTFSEPVDAEVRVKSQMGDRIFVYDGIDWKESETFYDINKGEAVAYVSGAYRVYVGKDKPYSSPSTFKAFSEVGRVRVLIPYKSNLNIIIYGLSGRKVKEITLKDLPAGGYEFSLKDLPKGVYMVKVFAGNNKAVVKVINGGGR
ncbi:MAG: T9SS type A sorting domain-containing protein [candidate division WOR-3 bacterium]